MSKNKKHKNITLDDLAGMMEGGFVRIEKNTDKKIDNLAGMVQRGFLDVDKKFIETKKQIKDSEERIKREIDGLELQMSSWISIYRRDIEILDSKINNAVERIEELEQKVGIRN